MRLLAISDIHGQVKKLKQLLELCKYDKNKDQLILLGDYTDRGYENIETIKYVMNLEKDGAIVLKGNHDQLTEHSILETLTGIDYGNKKIQISCDGYNTVNEILNTNKNELIEIYNFLKNLDWYYEYDKYIFCHSGVDAKKPLKENHEDDFLWSKWEFVKNQAYENKVIIFGHIVTYSIDNSISVLDSKIWKDYEFKDKIGIDCGSVYGGKLCCYSVLEDKAYYL